MIRRTGGLLVSGVRPAARMRVGLWRRASVVGGLVSLCCLVSASAALAGPPPVFAPVAGSPFAAGTSPIFRKCSISRSFSRWRDRDLNLGHHDFQ
jgi:hypothetical protein